MNYVKLCARLLKRYNLSIATAESLTGGMVASELVNIPGISKVFLGGYVTYCDETKHSMLGVKREILKKYGAVSKQSARCMAEYARLNLGCDIGLSTTGIAGPGGEEPDKPVGSCFISCAMKGKVVTRRLIITGNRGQIRARCTKEAFKLLYSRLKELK